MRTKYFSFSSVLGYGWRVMQAHVWFFVAVGFVWLILTYTPTVIDIISARALTGSAYVAARISTFILGWIISVVLAIGLIKIALSFCDGCKPAMGTLFNVGDCFWQYLGTAILYILIVFAGFLLLIAPGIVWSVKYGLCFYFVVDKGLRPVEAIKASGRTTMGVKWELFGFGILCSLINLLGLLCLVVGVFATYPTILLAYALVYRQLAADTPEFAEIGVSVRVDDLTSPACPSNEQV